MSHIQHNPTRLCWFRALQMSLFPIAIITVFWKIEIGLNIAQIMLLQALYGLSSAIFEFPSGYIADRIGYRRALIISSGLMIAGWSIYLVASNFWWALAAELILGVGYSLISGTDSAMMYESLNQVGRAETFEQWAGRTRFWGQSAEATTALLAGVLFAWWSRLPFVLECLIWVVNLGIALSLTEPSRQRPVSTSHWRQVREMYRYVTRRQPALLALFAFGIPIGLGSFIPVWLIPLHAHESGAPTSWLGPIWAVANYSVAVAAIASYRLRLRFGQLPTLLACVILMAIGYAGLGLSHHLFGFAFYYVLTTMRGLNNPILQAAKQRLIPSDNRAGLVSLHNLLSRLVFAVVGPLVGLAVDRWGQHAIFLLIGAVLSLVALVAWVWLRRAIANPMPVPERLSNIP
ncbi:MFS transporter [Candidatus Entotheonella serta]|nr:MFS transporter [Candidatus Entotheonella serta]